MAKRGVSMEEVERKKISVDETNPLMGKDGDVTGTDSLLLKIRKQRESLKAESEEGVGGAGAKDGPSMAPSSIFCCKLENPIRRLCIAITDSKIFEYFILFLVVANCVLWILYDPTSKTGLINEYLRYINFGLLGMFGIEAVLRIIAHGLFMHPDAYLKHAWDLADFIILLASVGMTVLSETIHIRLIDLKVIRAFRILRPLHESNALPSLVVVLDSIARSVVPLINIFVLVGFLVIIYAIIGVELFCGRYHATCVNKDTGNLSQNRPTPCVQPGYAGYDCDVGEFPELSPVKCSSNTTWPGPNHGITNFDNSLFAILTVFQCISTEGWTEVMYWTNDAVGYSWPWVYFVSLVVLGAFFVLKFIMCVLSAEFSRERERHRAKEVFQQKSVAPTPISPEKRKAQQQMDGYVEYITQETDGAPGEEQTTELMMSNGAGELKPTESLDTSKMEKSTDSAFPYPEHQTAKSWWTTKTNRKIRYTLRKIVKAKAFYWLVIILVALNTIVLCTEHDGQPQWMDSFQEIANLVFVVLFTLEMLVKMYALGLLSYFKSLFNRFDCFVVIISIIEVSLTMPNIINPLGVSVLRSARLLRVFKATKYWDAMRNLVSSLINSLRSIGALLVVLFIFIVVFALLGTQIFGGRYVFTDRLPPRAHFDTFFQSFLTVFQIMTGEDWDTVMHNGIDAFGGVKGNGMFAALFFVILLVLGNFILVNVFLAIAVDNLASGESLLIAEDEDYDDEDDLLDEDKGPKEDLCLNTTYEIEGIPYEVYEDEELLAQKLAEKEQEKKAAAMAARDDDDDEEDDAGGKEEVIKRRQMLKGIPKANSLFMFARANPIRVFCNRVVSNAFFTNFILVCILISSASLAAEDPLVSDSTRNQILGYFDYFFTSVFTIEIMLKVITYGFILHRGSFCREAFNLLDLLVVVVSLTAFFVTSGAISVVKILRVLRVLRPLRALNRSQGLKTVLQCLIQAVRAIGNLLVVTFLFMFIFAIVGVQVLKGTFYRCTDATIRVPEDCTGSFISGYQGDVLKPVVAEREWVNADFNFDHLMNALVSLIVVAMFEGWDKIMYTAIDSTEEGKGPIRDNRMGVSFFFIFAIIINTFFMMNIFVAFIITTFLSEGEREFEDCELDKNQRKCIEFALKAKAKRRYIPSNKWQYKLWRVVTSPYFEYTIFAVIIANTIILAMKHYQADAQFVAVMKLLNIIFTAIYTFEAFIKLIALKPRNYFADGWNVFDFVIVVGSLFDMIYGEAAGENKAFSLSFFRLFRVLRLVKLLARGESFRKLLWAFIKSFQALPFVSLLIALVFFIYSVVGMSVLGKIDNNPDTEINRNSNFQTFPSALMVLFRSATGEAWQDLMLATSNTPTAKCNPISDDYKLQGNIYCGTTFSYPYFISFVMMCNFLMINLFVAVIMDNFNFLTQDWSILGPHHLEEFVQNWSEFDPYAKGRIKHSDLISFLRKIPPPLGFGTLCPHRLACKRLVSMNMPFNTDGTVSFNATLFALVRTNLKIQTKGNINEANETLRETIMQLWSGTPTKVLDEVIPPRSTGKEEVTVGKYYATELIQYYFLRFKRRKEAREKSQQPENTPVPILKGGGGGGVGGNDNVLFLQAGLRAPEVDTVGDGKVTGLRRTNSGHFDLNAGDDEPMHRRTHGLFTS